MRNIDFRSLLNLKLFRNLFALYLHHMQEKGSKVIKEEWQYVACIVRFLINVTSQYHYSFQNCRNLLSIGLKKTFENVVTLLSLHQVKVEHMKQILSYFKEENTSHVGYLYFVRLLMKFLYQTSAINPFLPNVLNLHPLKTPKKQRFLGVFRRYKMGTLSRNGLNHPVISSVYICC